jgi:hypothetical protein
MQGVEQTALRREQRLHVLVPAELLVAQNLAEEVAVPPPTDKPGQLNQDAVRPRPQHCPFRSDLAFGPASLSVRLFGSALADAVGL